MQLTLSHDTKVTSCPVDARVPTFAKRLGVYLGKLIGIAILTAFSALIPIVHFASVPLGIIVFGYVAAVGFFVPPKVPDTTCTCPNCGAGFILFRRSVRKFPFYQQCGRCQQRIHITIS